MSNNEESWLRMMLDDDDIVMKMGLPVGMTDNQKNTVIETILNNESFMEQLAIEDAMATKSFLESDTTKPSDKTPCEWLVDEALADIDNSVQTISENFSIGKEISPFNIEVKGAYIITFPNGKECKVILNKILPNSMGDDYIFENISGAESLVEVSTSSLIPPNCFPIPYQLLITTKFNLLK